MSEPWVLAAIFVGSFAVTFALIFAGVTLIPEWRTSRRATRIAAAQTRHPAGRTRRGHSSTATTRHTSNRS